MLGNLRETVTSVLCHVELRIQRPDGALLQRPGEMHEGRETPRSRRRRPRNGWASGGPSTA